MGLFQDGSFYPADQAVQSTLRQIKRLLSNAERAEMIHSNIY